MGGGGGGDGAEVVEMAQEINACLIRLLTASSLIMMVHPVCHSASIFDTLSDIKF